MKFLNEPKHTRGHLANYIYSFSFFIKFYKWILRSTFQIVGTKGRQWPVVDVWKTMHSMLLCNHTNEKRMLEWVNGMGEEKKGYSRRYIVDI